MKSIYIFSGLGTDERVFKDIDLTGYNVVFIKWDTPHKGENIENYSLRLSRQIVQSHPVLIGLSFGGMVAMEVCKHIEVEKLILIASSKTSNEIPFYYKIAGQLYLNRLVPTTWLQTSTFITNWVFGASSDGDKKLLKEILRETDPDFLRWAINEIVHWKNKMACKKVIHIHGQSDKILPHRFVKANITVDKGGHFMTVNKSEELTQIIRNVLVSRE